MESVRASASSDAELLACRELDAALRLKQATSTYLRQTQHGRNVQREFVRGNMHSAHGRREALRAIVPHHERTEVCPYFRANAGCPGSELTRP